MEMLYLVNKATGKEIKQPVTEEEFAAMDAKGRGKKLFRVVRRIPSHPAQPIKAIERPQPPVPPEVTKIEAAKEENQGADPSPRKRNGKSNG